MEPIQDVQTNMRISLSDLPRNQQELTKLGKGTLIQVYSLGELRGLSISEDPPAPDKPTKEWLAKRIFTLLLRRDWKLEEEAIVSLKKMLGSPWKSDFEDWNDARDLIRSANKDRLGMTFSTSVGPVDGRGTSALTVTAEPDRAFYLSLVGRYSVSAEEAYRSKMEIWTAYVLGFKSGPRRTQNLSDGFKDAMYDVLMTPPWARRGRQSY